MEHEPLVIAAMVVLELRRMRVVCPSESPVIAAAPVSVGSSVFVAVVGLLATRAIAGETIR